MFIINFIDNKRKDIFYLFFITTIISFFSIAHARLPDTNSVRVDIVNDAGRAFQKYPVNSNAYNKKRAYILATNRQQYNIRLRNMTGERIAVVVAVDGRNILSGKKSWLRSNEKMYLLEPYQTSVYKGWRTGKNVIHRFFFTDAGSSYAGAWGDHSAMGVIAIAAFREKPRRHYRPPADAIVGSSSPAPAPTIRAPRSTPPKAARRANAGTGFGRKEHSETVNVDFRPEHNPILNVFYKYEWRSKLCKRGIVKCKHYRKPKPNNRFWQEEQGYAPYPPGR